jgi:hypothetical protein
MSSIKGSSKKIRRGKSMKHKKEIEEDKSPYDGPSKPYEYNPPGTGNSQNSITVSTNSNNLSFYSQDGGMSGERVKVAVRIRPLVKHEKGHTPILEVEGMK